MASTPPPLPSSSEDSDFDDDDFGGFSSAPVKAASNSFKNSEKTSQSAVDESVGSVTESAEVSSLNAENETLNKSDNAANGHSDSVKLKEEQPPADLFASDQFDEGVLPEPSQNLSAEGYLIGEHNDTNSNYSETSQGSIGSKETDMIDQVVDNVPSDENCGEKDDVGERNETVEHSTTARSGDDNSLSITDGVKSSSDSISNDGDIKFDQAQIVSDSQDTANLPCESKDEDDEYGDWSDMKTFKSDAIKNVDEKPSETDNESLNSGDNNGNDPESERQQVTAAAPGEEADNVSHPPRNDSPNVPLESCKTPDEMDHSQHSTSIDNDNDCKSDNDKDDDFGDFADFSSHQEKENDNTDKNLPPLSFRSSVSDENEAEKNVENTGDKDFVEEIEKDDSNVESVDSKDAGDDDFGDDWGFKSADTNDNDNGSDDFGNFGSADNGNNDGDWASFNETAVAANDDDGDDFNDFNESDFQTSSFVQSESLLPKVEELSSKVEKIVFMCFPDVSQPNQTVISQNQEDYDKNNKTNVEVTEIDNLCSVVEMGLKVTLKAKEETWTIVKELRNKDPMVGTWGRLKDVNSSHALDYGWNSSHCCQEIFNTLHIDTKNMLFSQKKQAVPFYASGLGILEPTRGGPNPAEKNQPPLTPTPVLLDTSKPEEPKKSLDIPPVDFDWGSSGLTNPLKVFKNDSFNNGLSALEPFSDVLHKNIEPTKELSSEAKSILSKIPNLNFMRSNVLMFPIKD